MGGLGGSANQQLEPLQVDQSATVTSLNTLTGWSISLYTTIGQGELTQPMGCKLVLLSNVPCLQRHGRRLLGDRHRLWHLRLCVLLRQPRPHQVWVGIHPHQGEESPGRDGNTDFPTYSDTGYGQIYRPNMARFKIPSKIRSNMAWFSLFCFFLGFTFFAWWHNLFSILSNLGLDTYFLLYFHRFNWHWMPSRGTASLIYRGNTLPMLTTVCMIFLRVVMMITLVNKSQIIVSQLIYLFAFDLIYRDFFRHFSNQREPTVRSELKSCKLSHTLRTTAPWWVSFVQWCIA